MLAGQRISRVGVVEFAGIFPVCCVVAGLAFASELSLMKILVAAKAVGWKSQKALPGIFVLDQLLHLHAHVWCGVALPAADRRVLPFQSVAGLVVVEFFLRGLPANELEALSVVLRVAAGAIPVGIVFLHHRGVESLVLGEPLVDLRVAVQAFQRAAGPQPMATRTLRQTGNGLMRFGKRAGGDLRTPGAGHGECDHESGDRKGGTAADPSNQDFPLRLCTFRYLRGWSRARCLISNMNVSSCEC